MALLHPWIRLEYNNQPVFIHPEKPDWFVPNKEADLCLKLLAENNEPGKAASKLAKLNSMPLGQALITVEELLAQIQSEPTAPYTGRADYLALSSLKECWFHLTNRCNLACGHCLFAASESLQETLDPELLQKGIAEARELGCTLFYFTGGEPLLYPDFFSMLTDLLADEEVHAVVLTNGMLLDQNRHLLEKFPQDRLHLQVSLDGLKKNHELQRGQGTFDRLMANLASMRQTNLPVTLSVAINRTNINELPDLVDLAAQEGIKNLHLLWHFVRGKGSQTQFVEPGAIMPLLIEASEKAEKHQISIDNIETLRGQVFSTPGTKHDLSNTGWESVAVGPDGSLFPSPALVDLPELKCGHLKEGLRRVWQKSPILDNIRRTSLADAPSLNPDPLKFLTGGGDIDHSYLSGGKFVGHDPYLAIYNDLILWLIVREASRYQDRPGAHILLRMGDLRHDCPEEGGHEVALTHCNCVVSLSADGGHATVREFYGKAAVAANSEIQNPFAPDQAKADFIPKNSKERSYGCGSPVQDAAPRSGEILVDLGSGSGVECFMAAKAVGYRGRVFGIDMTDAMLNLAQSSKEEVIAGLGYDNIEFKKGFLEALPLENNSADVIISNCVINLSPDKRRTFHEIYRVLKPGGRMVISDIVTESIIPPTMKNDSRFRGECLGGALQQEHLVAMLRAVGFTGIYFIKRFPYRQENGIPFFSLTFQCFKPKENKHLEVIYRGPLAATFTDAGDLLLKGKKTRISATATPELNDSFMVLDENGAVTNLTMTNSCCPTDNTHATIIPLSTLATLATPQSSIPDKSCCSDGEIKRKKASFGPPEPK